MSRNGVVRLGRMEDELDEGKGLKRGLISSF